MGEESWLSAQPPAVLEHGPVTLVRASLEDNEALVEAVNTSLEHLRPWMPWAQQPATSSSIGAFLGRAHVAWDTCEEFQYTIRSPSSGMILGCCGLHDRIAPGALEIGYWIDVRHIRRGLATTAASALTDAALGIPEVNRVEIHCDAANLRSAAVPKRLGYRLDRIDQYEPDTPGGSGHRMVWVQMLDRG